jgi:hypothetical protein
MCCVFFPESPLLQPSLSTLKIVIQRSSLCLYFYIYPETLFILNQEEIYRHRLRMEDDRS